MKKIQKLMTVFMMFFTTVVIAAASPISALEQASNGVITVLKQHQTALKNNPQIVYQAVKTHLLPIVDVTGMSRSVLGRAAWQKATVAEKKQFTQAFTDLVIRTYAKPLSEFTNESIQFQPLRVAPQGRFVRVNSLVVRPSAKDIPLVYSLVNKNGQWKVYDLSVEGVSLLQSFRSQFAQELRRGTMADLLKQMQQKQKAA